MPLRKKDDWKLVQSSLAVLLDMNDGALLLLFVGFNVKRLDRLISNRFSGVIDVTVTITILADYNNQNPLCFIFSCSGCSLPPHLHPASPMKAELNPKYWIWNIMKADVLESPLGLLLYHQWGTLHARWDSFVIPSTGKLCYAESGICAIRHYVSFLSCSRRRYCE